jgi:hypothetical protein
MSLEIKSLRNHGNETEEYLCLEVLEDTDLRNFLVLDATFASDGSVSNRQRHPHWFKPRMVKAGDFVWLYTGKGPDRSRPNKEKTTTHILYWGLEKPVWNNSGDTAVLFRISGSKALTEK